MNTHPINSRWDNKTIIEMFRRGYISTESAGWTDEIAKAVNGFEPCEHRGELPTSMMYRCYDCGHVHSVALNHDIADAVLKIRQGFADAESMIEYCKCSPEMCATLRGITICAHTSKIEYTCSDGNQRLMCPQCGRKFAKVEMMR